MSNGWPTALPEPLPPLSRLATSSLILGMLSLFGLFPLGPLALVLGFIARYRLKRDPQFAGKRLAVAGICLGLVATLLLTLLLVWLFAFSDYSLLRSEDITGPIGEDGGIIVYQDPAWGTEP